ncbi:hypothetical protein CHUAL_004138 [Chamberlinius hualienensis]
MWKIVKDLPKFWYNGKVLKPICVSSSTTPDDEIQQSRAEQQQQRRRKCCFFKYKKRRHLEKEKAVEHVTSTAECTETVSKSQSLVQSVLRNFELQHNFTYGTSYKFDHIRIPHTFEAIGLGFIVYWGFKHAGLHDRRCHQSDEEDESNRKCPGLANFLFSIVWAAGGRQINPRIRQNRLLNRETNAETANEDKSTPQDHNKADATVRDIRASLSDIAQQYASLTVNNKGEMCQLDGKYQKAFKYFEQASHMGLHQAMYNLGVCYETGQGVQQNLKQAFHYYAEAGKLGNGTALYNVAICYREGIGVVADETECIKYMSKASDLGIKEAQTFMGNYYGSHDEYDKAAVLFQKAVDQKHSDAEYFLGLCYEHGLGVELNTNRAAELFSKATTAGNAEAAYRMAIYYEQGLGGLEQNRAMSLKFLNEAADTGHELAIEKIKCEQEKEELKKQELKLSALSPDLNSLNTDDKSLSLLKSTSYTSIFDMTFVQHLIGSFTWNTKGKFTSLYANTDTCDNDENESHYWSQQWSSHQQQFNNSLQA